MGLHRNIVNERVSELELRDVLSVPSVTTCREAVEKMRQKELGCVIILDGKGIPLGMFTERMLISLLLHNPRSLNDPVLRHMTGRSWRVRLDDPIAKVIELMESQKVRFLCVVDEQGKAVGVTGQKGVMEFIADHFPRQVKVQRMSSEFFSDQREGA